MQPLFSIPSAPNANLAPEPCGHLFQLEKLLRSYQLDISRLLDISRSSIVFDTMEQLTAALGIIATDDNVRVERIKNRMCPEYSSDESAGYRDVCINLRPVNKEAVLLGAEMHMCEVQLILRQFAEIKTEEGHKRYVQARDAAGN